MKIGQKLISSLALASTIAYAGGVAPMSVVEVVPVVEENFFVYGGGGTGTADVQNTEEQPLIVLKPKVLGEDGTMGEIGIGYRYTENIFVTGFAQVVYLDKIDILNFNASINYRFTGLFYRR